MLDSEEEQQASGGGEEEEEDCNSDLEELKRRDRGGKGKQKAIEVEESNSDNNRNKQRDLESCKEESWQGKCGGKLNRQREAYYLFSFSNATKAVEEKRTTKRRKQEVVFYEDKRRNVVGSVPALTNNCVKKRVSVWELWKERRSDSGNASSLFDVSESQVDQSWGSSRMRSADYFLHDLSHGRPSSKPVSAGPLTRLSFSAKRGLLEGADQASPLPKTIIPKSEAEGTGEVRRAEVKGDPLTTVGNEGARSGLTRAWLQTTRVYLPQGSAITIDSNLHWSRLWKVNELIEQDRNKEDKEVEVGNGGAETEEVEDSSYGNNSNGTTERKACSPSSCGKMEASLLEKLERLQKWLQGLDWQQRARGEDGKHTGRALMRDIAEAKHLCGVAVSDWGCCIACAVEWKDQVWRVNSSRKWWLIEALFFRPRDWPRTGDLPRWFSALPPHQDDCTDYKEDFKKCAIYLWEDDEFGVWIPSRVLKPEGLEELRAEGRLLSDARYGVGSRFLSPLPSYRSTLDGYYGGREKFVELCGTPENLTAGPTDRPITEGPLSCVPYILTNRAGVRKLQPDGSVKVRAVDDATADGSNGRLEFDPVILPNLFSLCSKLESGAWLLLRDGRRMFNHFSLNQLYTAAMGVVDCRDGSYHVKRNLPFGVSNGVAVAQRLSRFIATSVKTAVPELLLAESWVDDQVLAALEEEIVARADEVSKKVAEKIGYIFDEAKTRKGQSIVIWGFLVSTLGDGWLSLPEEKLQQYLNAVEAILSSPQVTMLDLARVLGQLNFAASAVRGGAARLSTGFKCLYENGGTASKALEESVADGEPWNEELIVAWSNIDSRKGQQQLKQNLSEWNPDKEVVLSQDCRADLEWWLRFAKDRNGWPLFLTRKFKGRWTAPSRTGEYIDSSLDAHSRLEDGPWVITSDAADEPTGKKGGYFLGPMEFQLNFSKEDGHINELEFKTALHAIDLLGAAMKKAGGDPRVLTRIDNQVAKSVINKGHSSSTAMNNLAKKLADVCEEKGVFVTARWIPTKENTRADALSRGATPFSNVRVPSAGLLEEIRSLTGIEDWVCLPSGGVCSEEEAVVATLLFKDRRLQPDLPVLILAERNRETEWLDWAKAEAADRKVVIIFGKSRETQTRKPKGTMELKTWAAGESISWVLPSVFDWRNGERARFKSLRLEELREEVVAWALNMVPPPQHWQL